MENLKCPYCRQMYKPSYFKRHVERVHTHRDAPKYVREREKSRIAQQKMTPEQIRQRNERYYGRLRANHATTPEQQEYYTNYTKRPVVKQEVFKSGKKVNMTIQLFDGTTITDDVYIGYHTK